MVRFGLKGHDTGTTRMVPEMPGPANGQPVGNGLVEAEWDPSAGWRQDRDLVHEPTRLQLIALMLREGGATFQDLRVKLGLSDQEVAANAKRLESAGLIESAKSIGGTGMIVTFSVTPRGQQVMEGYCDWMRDILQGLPGSRA